MDKAVFLLLVFLSAVLPCGAVPPEEGPNAAAALACRVRELFESGNVDALDSLAGRFRSEKIRFADGSWKLATVYDALAPSEVSSSEAAWIRCRNRLEGWIKSKPESITPRVTLGLWWVEYAWKARGYGWADAVPADAWPQVKERLENANKVLLEAKELAEKCPHWFVAMQAVALGKGWEAEQYQALLDEAFQSDPSYLPIYFAAAKFMLPRWYGQAGDWEKFADAVATVRGDALYARIAWTASEYYADFFEQSEVSWDRMKLGFEAIEKEFPNSRWNLSHFARFACLARDSATAHQLFQRIGDDYVQGAWRNKQEFFEWRSWAALEGR